MEATDVVQAIETLKVQGKEPSIGNLRKVLGGGSLRDITKYRKQLLPHLGRAQRMDVTRTVDAPAAPVTVLEPAVVLKDADPVSAAPEAGPLTLLQQAEAAYQAALMAERRARRDFDMAPRAEWERLEQAWLVAKREREAAATLRDRRLRARATLIDALPAIRIAARRAAGELATAQETARTMLLRAQRQAELAQDDLSRMTADLVALAGQGALPPEEG